MVKKIIVTGSSGLIGQAMFQFIKEKKLTENYHLIPLSSKDCNLENWEETIVWFQNHSDDCDIVIHLAASVGGLYKNVNENTGMFEKNIKINMNVLKAVHQSGITRMISCLSTCIFQTRFDNIQLQKKCFITVHLIFLIKVMLMRKECWKFKLECLMNNIIPIIFVSFPQMYTACLTIFR